MLYRKVTCSERLPEETGEYLTDFGELKFDKDKLSFVEWIDEYDEDFGDIGGLMLVHPSYWLEEARLLTTEEFEFLKLPRLPKNKIHASIRTGYDKYENLCGSDSNNSIYAMDFINNLPHNYQCPKCMDVMKGDREELPWDRDEEGLTLEEREELIKKI